MVKGARRIAFAAMLSGFVVVGCSEGAAGGADESGTVGAVSSATGGMHHTRSSFPAVALPDGKVLVVGGYGTDLPYAGHRAELYDPATGTFAYTGSLHVGRAGHGAALLPDGRVLVTGGVPNGGGATIPDEVWDPATGAWTIVGTEVARQDPVVVTLTDGKVLVAGGGGDYMETLGSARVYDPVSETFTAVGDMVTPRSRATATLLDDGRVLVAGGDGACEVGLGCSVFDSAELFDPATGTFSAAHVMHTSRVAHSATKIGDGRVLVAGGAGERTTELYDPTTDEWSESAWLAVVRSEHRAALLDDGSVLFLGGQNGSGQVLASAERWKAGHGMLNADPIGLARRSFGLARLPDGAFLLAGGVGPSGYTATAALYSYSCTPTTQCYSGWCGPHPDGCGGTTDCGGCSTGVCAYGLCCVPQTCASLGVACGLAGDGCGGTLNCACANGGICTASNTCCAPVTCASLGRNCGTISNGCGGTTSCGACGSGAACSEAGVCQAVAGAAVYDATLKAPRCEAPGSCDSGSLLVGRANLGPEPNASNTLHGTCADATLGTFHGTESLDRLRVWALDGGALAPGKAARVEATVWAAGYTSNKLDLYVTADAQAASPVWTFLATLTPSGYSERKLSTGFTVPAGGSEVKAVRGVFRWYGVAGPCPGGSYTDVDDLVFSAALPSDSAAPSITVTSPAAGAVLTGTTTVTVAVADDVGVTGVSCSDGAITVGSASAPPFSVTWNTRLSANGAHGLTCTAVDASGKSGTSAPVNVTSSNDLTPPSIAFTDPAPGSTLAGWVALKVQATDDIGVVRVDYRLDGAALSWSTAAPFGVSWNANYTTNGPHTLTAVAKDAAGNTSAVASLAVIVDHETTPPVVSLTAPADGAALTGTVTLTATATDDVGVTGVSFYDGAYLLGTDTAPPYQYAWNTRGAANGAHVLTARAGDACNNVGTSAPANVTVSNDLTPPTVSLTSPGSGAVVSGTVTMTATATDNVGVVKVYFLDNWNYVCTVTAPPWTCAWNTTAVANGSHTLVAQAFDAIGQGAQSSAVTVTVSNVVVPPPSTGATWDPTLRAPRCGAGASCDSGTLLVGRGPLGPEPNAPNTINGTCADGASGGYHSDESLDRLKVSTVDGTPLAAGKTVRIEATVWAYSGYASDKLDLYYAASASAPSWTFLGTLTPAGAGVQTLSTTYTLPAGSLQAIRGTFRYGGSAGSCTSGGYDDHDDLVFSVQ